MNRKYINQYYRQVKKELAYPFRKRNDMLRSLRSDLDDFLESHPLANTADITAHFGAPEDFAERYFESLRTDEIVDTVRFHTLLRRWVCAALVVIVLAAVGFSAFSVVRAHNDHVGYGITQPPYDCEAERFCW